MSHQGVLSTKQQEVAFARILKKPHNQRCADCAAQAPTWASLDYGVFICMNCSGAHRNLGQNNTRVRSTQLDCWTQENLDLMDTLGNDLNEYWEARIPPQTKPTPEASLETLKSFAREKYVNKRWVKERMADPKTRYLQSLMNGLPFRMNEKPPQKGTTFFSENGSSNQRDNLKQFNTVSGRPPGLPTGKQSNLPKSDWENRRERTMSVDKKATELNLLSPEKKVEEDWAAFHNFPQHTNHDWSLQFDFSTVSQQAPTNNNPRSIPVAHATSFHFDQPATERIVAKDQPSLNFQNAQHSQQPFAAQPQSQQQSYKQNLPPSQQLPPLKPSPQDFNTMNQFQKTSPYQQTYQPQPQNQALKPDPLAFSTYQPYSTQGGSTAYNTQSFGSVPGQTNFNSQAQAPYQPQNFNSSVAGNNFNQAAYAQQLGAFAQPQQPVYNPQQKQQPYSAQGQETIFGSQSQQQQQFIGQGQQQSACIQSTPQSNVPPSQNIGSLYNQRPKQNMDQNGLVWAPQQGAIQGQGTANQKPPLSTVDNKFLNNPFVQDSIMSLYQNQNQNRYQALQNNPFL